MRKNYQTPSLKVLYLDAAPLLQTTSFEKSAKSIDMSVEENRQNVGWSKSFWGVTEDDSPSSNSDY